MYETESNIGQNKNSTKYKNDSVRSICRKHLHSSRRERFIRLLKTGERGKTCSADHSMPEMQSERKLIFLLLYRLRELKVEATLNNIYTETVGELTNKYFVDKYHR